MTKASQIKDGFRFDLIDGYYLRKLDDRNIALAKMIEPEKDGKKAYERVLLYSSSFEGAWEGAVNKLALMADSNEELKRIVQDLKELKTFSFPKTP